MARGFRKGREEITEDTGIQSHLSGLNKGATQVFHNHVRVCVWKETVTLVDRTDNLRVTYAL